MFDYLNQIDGSGDLLSLLLTDGRLGQDPNIMKPFIENKLNVVQLPITSAIGCCDNKSLADFLQALRPNNLLVDSYIK